ncbi:hypothetical protein Msil_1982 [Methylocella silvestris BL2]|uniref:PRC-barrel domain-containing protein n=1 Tax=Methylocella silvestris (strain DSM 15510 / CIP 108128 / LMG 27833 / NCIMB 13906 / BL2) TaxID=395965 RepID=B8EPS1_METSB|nr:hypothetical protein Msil_1982 [Methylocella silvestris BL2]
MKALQECSRARSVCFESHETGGGIEGRPIFDGANRIGSLKRLLIDTETGGPIVADVVLRSCSGLEARSLKIAWKQLSYDASLRGFRLADQTSPAMASAAATLPRTSISARGLH